MLFKKDASSDPNGAMAELYQVLFSATDQATMTACAERQVEIQGVIATNAVKNLAPGIIEGLQKVQFTTNSSSAAATPIGTSPNLSNPAPTTPVDSDSEPSPEQLK